MRRLLQSVLIASFLAPSVFGQIDISDAIAQGAGSEVTVRGIAISGPELGRVKYIQDETGGLAAYSASLDDLEAGSDVTITGTLKDYYGLLELDPVSSFTIHSTGNALPDPVVLSPDELGDAYVGQLVQIKNAVFEDAGSTFAASTNYNFTADGESGEIRISSYSGSNPNEGAIIPSGEVTLTGVLSQYYSTYQILVRYTDDILPESSISLTSTVSMSNLSTTGFTLSWETNMAGSTQAFWGNTPALEGGMVESVETVTEHNLDIVATQASELFYIQPFSVSEGDTAKASVGVYISQSESSGEMIAYFNHEPDLSVSTGTDAIYLDEAMDDTLIQYINRAEYSIDFTIYNFNNTGLSNISDALNDAYDRGVEIRVIYDSNIDAVGVESLNSGIGKIASPISDYPNYGIMHNKFIVFDVHSPDPDQAIVWTGSTNFTDGQMNTDPNNIIIVHDQSLAIAYWLEFNEMFGSDGSTPDSEASRFGPDKSDNTPHEFLIGGKRVECYFSPSDGTNAKIIESIESADDNMSIATMLITRDDISYAIIDAVDNNVESKMLVNVKENCDDDVLERLKTSLSQNFRETGESGIMHHKYMVVDNGNEESDPLVLTGCHNWSSSAEIRNDENTLIIHDATLANIYYQDFIARFNNGELIIDAPECTKDFITMDENTSINFSVTDNDDIPSDYGIEIIKQPTNGTSVLESDMTITYTPDAGFNNELDTTWYKVCLDANPDLCDSSFAVVYVNLPVGIDEPVISTLRVYPNPAGDFINIYIEDSNLQAQTVEILDISGKTILNKALQNGYPCRIEAESLDPGSYFVVIRTDKGVIHRKIVKK